MFFFKYQIHMLVIYASFNARNLWLKSNSLLFGNSDIHIHKLGRFAVYQNEILIHIRKLWYICVVSELNTIEKQLKNHVQLYIWSKLFFTLLVNDLKQKTRQPHSWLHTMFHIKLNKTWRFLVLNKNNNNATATTRIKHEAHGNSKS